MREQSIASVFLLFLLLVLPTAAGVAKKDKAVRDATRESSAGKEGIVDTNKQAMTINDMPNSILEELVSKLDIPSQIQLSKTSHRFNEVAKLNGSWNAVTGLKVAVGNWQLALQVTMADGRTHSSLFAKMVELSTKSRELMASCRKLTELVYAEFPHLETSSGYARTVDSFFPYLFRPPPPHSVGSPLPNPNPPLSSSFEFPCLKHLSVFPLQPPDFLLLTGVVSRLAPLRRLHSFAYHVAMKGVQFYNGEQNFLRRFFVANPDLELLHLGWQFSRPLQALVPRTVKFLKIYLSDEDEDNAARVEDATVPACFQTVRALAVECLRGNRESFLLRFVNLAYLDIHLNSSPPYSITTAGTLGPHSKSLQELRALRYTHVSENRNESLLAYIAHVAPRLEHLSLAEVLSIKNWNFSPLAKLFHLRTFHFGVAEYVDLLIMSQDAVQLIVNLPPSLEALALFNWKVPIYVKFKLLSDAIKTKIRLREVRISITDSDYIGEINELVDSIREGLDLVEESLAAARLAQPSTSTTIPANSLTMHIHTGISDDRLKNIENDRRKHVQFHHVFEDRNGSVAFWMNHGVPVAKAQLQNPPTDPSFYAVVGPD